MRTSFVQIIRPNFNPQKETLRLKDFVTVPRLDTIGTFQIVDLLPFETLAGLSLLRDELAKGRK